MILQLLVKIAREIDLIIQCAIVLMGIMKTKSPSIVKSVSEIVLLATKTIVSLAKEIEF